MQNSFEYGSTRVKPHRFGDWVIEEFTVSEDEAKFFNMRQAFQGKHSEMITAGKFLRLMQVSTGYTVMSNTPMELKSNEIAFKNARGSVLIAGLGMGMILEAMLTKSEVTHIRIIEADMAIIQYVGNFFKDDPRVEIIHGDIHEYEPASDEQYDYIWIDIWDDIDERNIEQMAELNERFSKHCINMNLWSMDLLGCEPEDYYKIAM